ncbi:4517_t:CDS:1, partial [Scutellospora calospora]
NLPDNTTTLTNEKLFSDDDPKNWPIKKKWLVLIIVTISGMLAPISSTQ